MLSKWRDSKFLFQGFFTGQSGFLDFWKDFLINDNYNLSLAGGIIGFSVVFFYKIYKRKQQGQLAKYIDIITPSFLISGVIWYIGALFGGQVYGTPSTAFFAINYNTKNSLIPGTLFPLPIFYVIGILVLLFVMYKINKKPNIPEGYTGLLLMGLFGVLLFFGEFFSGSPDMFEVFIRINQLIGIIFIVAALIWIIKFFRS